MRLTPFIFLLVSFISSFAQSPELSRNIIVKFRNGSAIHAGKNEDALVSFGITVVDSLNQKYFAKKITAVYTGRGSGNTLYTIEYNDGVDLNKVMNELNATGLFDYTEPDYIGRATGIRDESDTPLNKPGEVSDRSTPLPVPDITPDDLFFYEQWALSNDGTFSCPASQCPNPPPPAKAGADIKMKAAWDLNRGSSAVKVGFIDSGCRLNHPDLTGRIWVNTGEIPNNGIDDDANGFIDDINGWDFQNGDNEPSDDFGHGTNTAGIVGANGNNAMGLAGVDWYCKLMIAKALDNTGKGLYSSWVSSIHYLVDNGADIINMSVAGTSNSISLQNAIDYAYKQGVLVVASMGNDNTGSPYYPAACHHVMAVGATNVDDNRCNPFEWGGGSNYGSWISVVAPGNIIHALSNQPASDYTISWSGTSESAPYTSGLAALLKAQFPSRTPDQLKTIIELTADDQVGNPLEDTPGRDIYYGSGRINAFKALNALSEINKGISGCAQFEIFPNPATHNPATFQVKLSSNVTAEITITDLTGKTLWQRNPSDVTTVCGCDLAAGMYFVTCRDGVQTVTKKLVIY